jgi:hypothetical protein
VKEEEAVINFFFSVCFLLKRAALIFETFFIFMWQMCVFCCCYTNIIALTHSLAPICSSLIPISREYQEEHFWYRAKIFSIRESSSVRGLNLIRWKRLYFTVIETNNAS